MYIYDVSLNYRNDDDYDYIVIINYPHPNFKYDEKKVILISTEPYMILNYWVNDLKKELTINQQKIYQSLIYQ